MLKPGRCRWCRCTHDTPCPNGCGWADRDQTLCTECRGVELFWGQQPARPGNMVRAFFRGFMAGSEDERSVDQANPYRPGDTARFWSLGHAAGVKEATKCVVTW